MQHPRFRSGELTTGFIAEEYPEGFEGAPASGRSFEAVKLAAVGGVIATADADRARHASISSSMDEDFLCAGRLDHPHRRARGRLDHA